MFDLIIRNGLIVDGTGAPGRPGAVAVRGDRIAAIGEVAGPARHEIDAAGRVIAPGFIDVHTHYDAQVFWDPLLTPSINHGVTTVIAGNCGFTIAPLSGRGEDADYLVRMLARVEGMPLESLRAAVPMDWTSFGEYLDRLEGGLAINTGFMVGHSALRRTVMGERAIGHCASPDEISAMQELLRDSIRAGGLGFSSTISTTHFDAEGAPVPSRHASEEELLALARVVSEFPGTTLEFLPIPGLFGEETYDLLTRMSLAAQRPLNWNAIIPNAHAPEVHRSQIAAANHAAARGARVVGLVMADAPHLRLNMLGGVLIDAVEGIAQYFRMPLDERRRAFADPAVRREIAARSSEQQGHARKYAQWQDYEVAEVFSDENRPYLGQRIGSVAAARGVSPLDAILDVALADELRTNFLLRSSADDDESWAMRGEVWTDDRVVIGASDAGAHLDMIDTFAFSSKVLGEGVRRRRLLSLEDAVHRLTQVPAELIGIRDRGCLRAGAFADMVVFDPETIGCGPTGMRFDLPAGGSRLYCDALGVAHVFVNGREVAAGGVPNGARAGTMLRSGRDTYTVAIGG